MGLNQLISNVPNGWKVGLLLLEHEKNHSLAGWRDPRSSLFSVVEAGPLQVSVTQEMSIAISELLVVHGIMPFHRIGPAALVVR